MGYKEVSCRMKVPVSAASLSSSFHHHSGAGADNESPKKIVLTKLSRRTKLLAYGTTYTTDKQKYSDHHSSDVSFAFWQVSHHGRHA